MKKSIIYQLASFFSAIFSGVLLAISSDSGFILGYVFAFVVAVGSAIMMKQGAEEYYYETKEERKDWDTEEE